MREARIDDLKKLEGITTNAELAARVGVHYSTISLWARGKAAPSELLRERVCRAFDGRYSEDWLFPRRAPWAAVEPEREAMAV